MRDRAARYAEVALERACNVVAAAPPHQRTDIINKECFGIGRLVGGGVIDLTTARAQLLSAAMRAGWDRREAEAKVSKAIGDGTRQPRTPDLGGARSAAESAARAEPAPLKLEPPAPAPEKPLPPAAIMNSVWNAAIAAADDSQAVAYFARRRMAAHGISPSHARVMRRGAPKPPCMRHLTPDHRVLIPVNDHLGYLRSFRVRSLDPKAERKSLAPAGFRTRGLLFSCSFARRVLRLGHPSTWAAEPEPWGTESTPFWPADLPVTFIVAEGEADFLSYTLDFAEAEEHAPAVLGVFASSWSRELAQRIPDRSRVIIATDQDAAGDKYASEIVVSFRGRDMQLSRWTA